MVKVPYESMAIEAGRLIILAAVSPDPQAWHWFHRYHDFLMACGWTSWEFDRETLRRVDAVWDRIYRQNFSPIIWN